MKKVILIMIFSVLIIHVNAQEKKMHHKNGQLYATGNYTDGSKTGEWKKYHDNGKLSRIGKYDLGNIAGEWKHYYENGQLKAIKAYSENKLMEIVSLRGITRNKLDKGTLVNGNGTVHIYDDEGYFLKTFEYMNGKKKK